MLIRDSFSSAPGQWATASFVATTAAAGAIVAIALLAPPGGVAIIGMVALGALALLGASLLTASLARLYVASQQQLLSIPSPPPPEELGPLGEASGNHLSQTVTTACEIKELPTCEREQGSPHLPRPLEAYSEPVALQTTAPEADQVVNQTADQTELAIPEGNGELLDKLPAELFHKIFSFLDKRDLVHFSTTCHDLRNHYNFYRETVLYQKRMITSKYPSEWLNYHKFEKEDGISLFFHSTFINKERGLYYYRKLFIDHYPSMNLDQTLIWIHFQINKNNPNEERNRIHSLSNTGLSNEAGVEVYDEISIEYDEDGIPHAPAGLIKGKEAFMCKMNLVVRATKESIEREKEQETVRRREQPEPCIIA